MTEESTKMIRYRICHIKPAHSPEYWIVERERTFLDLLIFDWRKWRPIKEVVNPGIGITKKFDTEEDAQVWINQEKRGRSRSHGVPQ